MPAAVLPALCPARAATKRKRSRAALAALDSQELRTGLVALVPHLKSRAMRLCGDGAVADDVVQDTIERALRFARQYRRGTSLRAWVSQILFTVFVTRWRRQRCERDALEGMANDPSAWTSPAGFPPPDGGPGGLMASAKRKLEKLPEGFGAVVVLVDIEERFYRDAAAQLGLPVGTVMSRLHRGRKVLAEQLAGARSAA